MSKSKASNYKGEPITYYRSIENRWKSKEYIAHLENEFFADLTEITSIDRRSMLKFMGASIALAGIGLSCRRPEEKILPYVHQPENIIPGIPNYYATAQPTSYGAFGLLVESHEGRPTKIEGNPSHPQNLGKASIFNQAAILELYDPDRSRFCIKENAGVFLPTEWAEFDNFFEQHCFLLKKAQGQGLAIVTNGDLSPTLLSLKKALKKEYPKVKFYVHDPMRLKNTEEACSLTFGPHTRLTYHLANAKTIVSLFADPFSFGPEHLRHNHGFAKNRQVLSPKDAASMNRLYAVEADYSLTGTKADHRLRLPLGMAVNFIKALAYELHASHGLDITHIKALSLSKFVDRPPSYKGLDRKFIMTMAKDLAHNKGKAIILGGDILPSFALSLINLLNIALLGEGKTFDVLYVNDAAAREHLDEQDIAKFSEDLNNYNIDTALLLGINPVYDGLRHLNLQEALKKAKTVIHLGQSVDETAKEAHWHIPQTHFLEHFADTRSYDGVITIIQPLIKPLHDARSTLQILAQMLEDYNKDILSLIKENYKYAFYFDESKINKYIHDGVVENSNFTIKKITEISSYDIYENFNKLKGKNPDKNNLELIIDFDRRILDGRLANHGWLQELADPVTKINWGNALLMSPVAAKEYGIKSQVKKNVYLADLVTLSVDDKSVELPVFVMPGLSDYSLCISLGYGRKEAGFIGNGVGFDVYDLLPDYHNRVLSNIKLTKTSSSYRISSTQEQFAMNGDVIQETDTLSLETRDPARVTDIADYVKDPLKAKESGIPQNLLVTEGHKKQPMQLTKPWDYSLGNQWGMVIDLAKCTGCNACVIACQSENNIPIVGKEQVIRGRQMAWIRVDRYYVGDVKNPKAITQPVPCQHCENAPCEPVCPVAATSHDKEGLNVMTYNRCVGTRYCANNCPYKVRRFNYFDFSDSGNLYVEPLKVSRQKTLKLQRNPDVTVRYRGVMEKCTYCTQRIQEAKMKARRVGKDPNNLPDGAVIPACAQTCPSEAIVFGNINDESSRVSLLKKVDRNYTMLDVLNVRPRTSYLSMLRNPHEDLAV